MARTKFMTSPRCHVFGRRITSVEQFSSSSELLCHSNCTTQLWNRMVIIISTCVRPGTAHRAAGVFVDA